MTRPQETVLLPGLALLSAGKQEVGVNLSQQSALIGLNRSHYHNIVNLRKGASLAAARDIARYFGVPIDELLESAPGKVFA